MAGLGVYEGVQLQRFYQDQAAKESRVDQERSGERWHQECLPLPLEKEVQCTRQIDQADRENEREERDLEAQRVTAIWTSFMGMAAMVGMAFGIVGVGLVFITFRETREANEISRRQFEAAYKPLLEVKIHGPYASAEETPHMAPGQAPLKVRLRVSTEISNCSDRTAIITAFWIAVKDDKIGHAGAVELHRVLNKGDSFFVDPVSGEWTWGGEAPRTLVGEVTMTPENFGFVRTSPPPVIGGIRYEDTIGKRRIMGFGFIPGTLWADSFRRWGGDQFNYDREVQKAGKHRSVFPRAWRARVFAALRPRRYRS